MCTQISRLLLVTSDYHYYRDGKVHTTSSFMRFVPHLLSFCERIEICAPVHQFSDAEGYTIESGRIGYRPLPPSRTIEAFVRRFPCDGLRILRRLYQGIRRADLVWINGPHPLQPLAAVVAKLTRKPYLLYARGDIVAVARPKYIGAGVRNQMALRTAYFLDRLIDLSARDAAVFYVGSNLRRHARHARFARPVMTSLVEESQLASSERSDLHSPVRLLWAGQLRPVKGLPYLLRAVRTLLDRGHQIHLTLVGDGEQREALESEIATLGLTQAVTLVGYVAPGPELDRYFKAADLFVLPSLSEGLPKVTVEAMARALPVIGTEVGGVPDLVRDRENGLLIPPANAGILTDTLERVIADDDLRERMSAGSLAFAREHTADAEVRGIRSGLLHAFPELWR